jgi:hypothetical protein
MTALMISLAIMSTAVLAWAITGEPVQAPIAAFAGFVCGFSWALVYAMTSLERAGI